MSGAECSNGFHIQPTMITTQHGTLLMLALQSGMERLGHGLSCEVAAVAAAAAAAAARDRGVRLAAAAVAKDMELDLPPHIALPDGEEYPHSTAHLHLRHPQQESEIYQKCIRPPPNRTVFDGESPPPYRWTRSPPTPIPAPIPVPAPTATAAPLAPDAATPASVDPFVPPAVIVPSCRRKPAAARTTSSPPPPPPPPPSDAASHSASNAAAIRLMASESDIPTAAGAAVLTVIPCLTERLAPPRTQEGHAAGQGAAGHGAAGPSPPTTITFTTSRSSGSSGPSPAPSGHHRAPALATPSLATPSLATPSGPLPLERRPPSV